MEQLTLQFLGTPRFFLNQSPVYISGDATILLAYLALQPGPFTRAELGTFMWEGQEPGQWKPKLDVVLAELTATLGSAIQTTAETVNLSKQMVCEVDSLSLAEAYERVDQTADVDTQLLMFEAVAQLYTGAFLSNVGRREPCGWTCLEWVVLQRERQRLYALEAIQTLALAYFQHRDYDKSFTCTQRWLELEPLMEVAHRQMMQLWQLRGQLGQAYEQYKTCRRLLKEGFGVDPLPHTQELGACISMAYKASLAYHNSGVAHRRPWKQPMQPYSF